ncbi:MAG: helix-turn-helix domain-containing protein [Gemmatimonadales bacterium]
MADRSHPGRPVPRSGCPIGIALDLVGDRWSLLVVRDLLFGGPRTYRDLAAAPEKIATNILADRLARLEGAGVIERTRDPEDRRRAIYSLTERGVDLAPVLIDLALWSAHYEKTAAPREAVRRMETDREGMLAEIRSHWEASRAALPDAGRRRPVRRKTR